jgi:2-amino-4-hydroxy-6-hydroxymethyldihydropteridine diphosphokinase
VKVFLGLGTNIGDRRANLEKALSCLKEAGIKIKKTSSVYETEPIGVVEQEWFYNMVVEAETKLPPLKLLSLVKGIEKKMGRVNSKRWGPRLIDIDLLMYDNLQFRDTTREGYKLKLPHPEIKNRAFVVLPLLEIAPEVTLPDGSSVKKFLEYTKEQKIRKIKNDGDRPHLPILGPVPRKEVK